MEELLVRIEDVLNGKYRFVEGQPVRRSYFDMENIGIENMKYKVGDKVRIKSIDWYNENKDEYDYIDFGKHMFYPLMSKYCGEVFTIDFVYSDFYTMNNNDFEWTDGMIEGLVEEETTSDKVIEEAKTYWDSIKDAWICPEGYIFKDENGNVINATKIVLEKKKKEYPKTYEECCKILGFLNVDLCFNADYRSFDASKEQWKRLGLMNQFYQLLICRDAYWKIAGEEMGLDGPWKPDWNDGKLKWCMSYSGNYIEFDQYKSKHHTLAFPTAEMRDAFYENFKEEIEKCKELL